MPFTILAALMAAAATTPPALAPQETEIPFVASQGILDWKPTAGDDSLYIRGSDGRWYFVRTMNRCPRLRAALALSFETSAVDQLDRHGAVWAQGVRCAVDSIVLSDPPPRKLSHRGR